MRIQQPRPLRERMLDARGRKGQLCELLDPYRFAAPAGGVPWTDVKFLWHADETAGSTNGVDSGPDSRTMIIEGGSGSGATTATQSRFGGLSWNTRGALYIEGLTGESTSDFVCQASVYYTSAPVNSSYQMILAKSTGTGFWNVRLAVLNGLYDFSVCSTAPAVLTHMVGPAPTTGAWDDIACTRHGDVFELWVNGVSVATQTFSGVTLFNEGNWCINGFFLSGSTSGGVDTGVYMDEFRLLKNFYTPSVLTAAFPNS